MAMNLQLYVHHYNGSSVLFSTLHIVLDVRSSFLYYVLHCGQCKYIQHYVSFILLCIIDHWKYLGILHIKFRFRLFVLLPRMSAFDYATHIIVVCRQKFLVQLYVQFCQNQPEWYICIAEQKSTDKE